VTTAIVQRARLIAVGNVSSQKLAKTSMAKSVYDAGWGQLRTCLEYKAKRLGVTYREVNEAYSSVTCADYGIRSGPRGLGVARCVARCITVITTLRITYSVPDVARCRGLP
jgi:putative transposase